MAITRLDVFLGNLKRLIYDSSNKLIASNRLIQARMLEIQLFYEELDYLIESGFNNMINNDEEPFREVDEIEINWKRRLMDVAHKAENIIDTFISTAILKQNLFFISMRSNVVDCPLHLKDVLEDLKSIGEEMSHHNNTIQHHVEYSQSESSSQVSETSFHKVNPCETEHQHEQVIVGFDDDALSIMDRLTRDGKHLDFISIVGMGGVGKTTLATKIFNDPYVVYYFGVRGWITVSETYAKRDLLIELLASIGKPVHEETTEFKLCEMVYKSLKGRKYLIVIDDVWSATAWDDLRLYFPDDKTGSRILITTRVTEVACHARLASGFAHHLQCLNEEKSWELLHKKTFRGYDCPESLIEAGKHIAKKCGGLPLALVVMAGVLENGEKSKDMWEKVAESVSSHIVEDPKGCLDTLALSYDHLPRHLRNCFLYAGGFPEDCEIQVWRLIRLWMAEGFIKESAERSLEEQAEDYLMDLVDRNLLIVVNRRSDGGIKSCRMHDILRELCLIKASEEKFFIKKIDLSYGYRSSYFTSSIKEQHHRLFADYKVLGEIYNSHDCTTHMRSVLCFFNTHQSIRFESTRWVPSFLLLRVLDILNIRLADLSDIFILIHLRYLAVWRPNHDYSFSVRNLWNLQTLILKGEVFDSMDLNMENMVDLRHLWSERTISIDSRSYVLCNLQTLSRVRLAVGDQNLMRSFPNIKKLACSVSGTFRDHAFLNFALLTHLEALDVEYMDNPSPLVNPVRLPETLKKLTLKGLRLPWTYMSKIRFLTKLEVLKLLDSSFEGNQWVTGDEQFRKLKFLKLENLNIHLWEASSMNFPQLRKLEVRTCKNLKEIPLEIGDISTLEHIEIDDSNSLVLRSVNEIQEKQREMGNYDIHVKFVDTAPQEVFFEGDPYYE
ncbi:putative late blight resistance protein homolog R1A-10 [Lactuca sativa]|uniref:NB-ARC domain-containing protein n=1 Tax=Lactuca sativa TaxID=4236 RepID=A0A9R1UIS7_LACSA|nr:putative late blight resistance protein homolog R1A-10 [Lactuca sativa]KAJ0187904.1 hypothetical protein LSAT_V11C900466990 [Lactuca sativa]